MSYVSKTSKNENCLYTNYFISLSECCQLWIAESNSLFKFRYAAKLWCHYSCSL